MRKTTKNLLTIAALLLAFVLLRWALPFTLSSLMQMRVERRAQRLLTQLSQRTTAEELRIWAFPYLANETKAEIIVPAPLKNLEGFPILTSHVAIDVGTGHKFVTVIFTLGMEFEALLIGQTNATCTMGRLLRKQWADGFYYVADSN